MGKPARWFRHLADRHTDQQQKKWRKDERRNNKEKGRRQQRVRQTARPGVWVSEIKTHWTSLLGWVVVPHSLSRSLSPAASSKPLQLHACECRPSGRKRIVFAEGHTVPASYADWSGGPGKPYSPCFKHNKQNAWMYAIVLHLKGGQRQRRGDSVRLQYWSDEETVGVRCDRTELYC